MISSLLIACNTSDEKKIGLDLKDNKISTHFTEVPVTTEVVLLDSIITSNRDGFPFGSNTDGDFGTITCESFANIALGDDGTVDLGTNPKCSKVTLYLVHSLQEGDPVNAHDVVIKKLTSSIDETKTFYNTDNYSTNVGNQIGKTSYTPAGDDLDTIEITLETSFGDQLISSGGELSDNDDINALNTGVNITIEGASSSVFSAIKSASYLEIEYDNDEDEDLTYEFRLGFGFSTITTDYTGTIFENKPLNTAIATSELGNKCFLRDGVGIVTKITPDFDSLKRIDLTSINRAELVLTPHEDGVDADHSPISDIFASYATDENRLLMTTEDASIREYLLQDYSSVIQAADYNATGRSYENLELTSVLQNIVNNSTSEKLLNGIFISPSLLVENSTVRRITFNDSAATLYPATIKLYYTK